MPMPSLELPAPAPTAEHYAEPQWAPSLGAHPAVRSVIVNLPPQRTTSPDPAPPVAPPTAPTPTVLPAAAPSTRTPNSFVAAGGTFVGLLVVVVLVFALPAHGAKSNQPSAGSGNSSARLDLRNLATAEETNLTATMRYTNDVVALEGVGYMPSPGATTTVLAGIHGKAGYCLIAGNRQPSRWYLYDSKQGGLISRGFASQAAAKQACVDSAITSYATIS